jgi:2-C-methyl-D-erythritol 2,4-cyclodiphosphate synthase
VNHRVGLGYDIHRLEPGEGIILAACPIACPYRIVAHSDGDVVLHALCDALLGAVGAGDLGEHFPDHDPLHQGRDSTEFVREILALPVFDPWRLVNFDLNIIAQAPRLTDHKPRMRQRLSELFALPIDAVGLKARTNEHCDAVGAKQALVVHAVVLLAHR